jgi:hypothetical protein
MRTCFGCQFDDQVGFHLGCQLFGCVFGEQRPADINQLMSDKDAATDFAAVGAQVEQERAS